MLQNILGFMLVVLLGAGLNLKADDSATSVPAGYHLVWADEFSKDPDGLPDPKKWSYEEGFLRNHESQYYTKERKENARVENGQLVIEARKETFCPIPTGNPATSTTQTVNYTSASLETKGKASWQYGRVEIKAKLPAGDGVWPAFWMLGTGMPKLCGEIDIMELVGKNPDVIHGTIHYCANKHNKSSGGLIGIYKSDSTFHVYAMEWTPEHINFFVDARKYFSFDVDKATTDGQNPFRQPYYLKLNLALGGSWGGPIDDSIFPQRMVVDYVRVYQKTTPSP